MKKRERIEIVELRREEIDRALDRAKGVLAGRDYEVLRKVAAALVFLLGALLFGSKSEKTEKVLEREVGAGAGQGDLEGEEVKGAEPMEPAASLSQAARVVEEEKVSGASQESRGEGHGRNGASDYAGAERIVVAHEALKAKDICPGCKGGKVYPASEPGLLVRLLGRSPIEAKVYELEKLRCNACGEVFTARAPEGVGEEKYDASAASMIALLRYGSGLPFNRVERLERNFGIPLPASTQWEIARDAAGAVVPAYEELRRLSAQGEVLHNDDTSMKILELMGKRREEAIEEGEIERGERTGIFTSSIVARVGGRTIALYATGRRHAGENLARVLKERPAELDPPIQMCDALSRNPPGECEVRLANCLAHGRRRFIEELGNFPEECRHVIEVLGEVYRNDALARGLSAPERLALHQERSRPLMEGLREWLSAQVSERRVEPNSGLGDAIEYMLRHWEKLTLFLREPGAPLDNNLCERALKRAILHRKNSLFYKTQNGARVGDVFMSLIHTAELSGTNPFDYLTALGKNAGRVRAAPGEWLPWNYEAALEAAKTT